MICGVIPIQSSLLGIIREWLICMNPEEFRNLAQGIQAILVAFGLLIAGLWAIYRFRSLLSTQKARADLAKTRAELDTSKADLEKIHRELEKRAVILVKIEPFVLGDLNAGQLYLRIRLTLTNSGNQVEDIDWKESSVMAAEIKKTSEGLPLATKPINAMLIDISFKVKHETLFPGETSTKEFLVPIEHHALYLIEACIYASEASAAIIRSAGSEIVGMTEAYSAVTYIDSKKSESHPTQDEIPNKKT